jgi:hypothetical protein
MTNPIPYIIQGDNIIMVVNNESHTINKTSHMNYAKILDAMRAGDWATVEDLVDVSKSLLNYSNGQLSIKDGVLFWNGREFHNALGDRIIKMYEQGFPVDAMIAFMNNLLQNPSYRAVEELYGFLEKNLLPLTSDGCFLAYKKVKFAQSDNPERNIKAGDFVDIHSGTFRNNVGDVVTMQRNLVNDDAKQTCSEGLHFASLSYMPSFGGVNPIVILKINPKDVVSIPVDYNQQKGRCCEYTVVGVHGKPQYEEAFDNIVDDSYSPVGDDGAKGEEGVSFYGNDNFNNPNTQG